MRRRKYFSARKCANRPPQADGAFAQRAASTLSENPAGVFRQSQRPGPYRSGALFRGQEEQKGLRLLSSCGMLTAELCEDGGKLSALGGRLSFYLREGAGLLVSRPLSKGRGWVHGAIGPPAVRRYGVPGAHDRDRGHRPRAKQQKEVTARPES